MSILDQDVLKMDKDFRKHLDQMIKDLLNEKKDLASRLVAFDEFLQHLWFRPKLPDLQDFRPEVLEAEELESEEESWG